MDVSKDIIGCISKVQVKSTVCVRNGFLVRRLLSSEYAGPSAVIRRTKN